MRWISSVLARSTREPAFAAIFIATLALGVGANAALFCALRGYFLAPLPYPHTNRLIVIEQQALDASNQISSATYEYLRRNAHSISAGGLAHDAGGILEIGSAPAQKVRLEAVTASWFTALGVSPFLGRTFGADADKPRGPHEVVLSYAFWRNALHADPDVLGKPIMLNAQPQTVVGVMPPGFYFASRAVKFWVPTVIDPAELVPGQTFNLIGRRFVARSRPGSRRPSRWHSALQH